MSNPGALVYYRTAEQPDIRFWLLDDNGALIDFSDSTFTFKVGMPGQAAVFTKTTGITGAVGAGSEPTGTPNVAIGFISAELDLVPADTYTWQLRATAGGLDRVYQGIFYLIDVIA